MEVIERENDPVKPPELLERISLLLKTTIANSLTVGKIIDQIARKITIKRKPYAQQDTPNSTLPDIKNNTPPNLINRRDPLMIQIENYYFKLIEKIVIFDRRYVNFNVYNARGEVIHKLTAYASSSQVGAWRLCKTEPVNRLNKFDDYVQSTIIHWKLSRFICYWFYRSELLWADEAITGQDGYVAGAENRNNVRNNRAPFIYQLPGNLPRPFPQNFPQNQTTPAAIPVYYVMEDRLYAYQSLPPSYNDRTAPDNTITCQIVDRGLGSLACYTNINCGNTNCPLPAPCPFDYWQNNGTCGDNLGEDTIKLVLNRFSQILNNFYYIEPIDPNDLTSAMKITELYTDCMVYKNFKQEAHVFKVRLIPKPGNNFCYPNSNPPIQEPVISENQKEFYKQTVDLVFVHYTIQQWADSNYEPKECYDNSAQREQSPPSFNIQGYYILTIIPTKVLNVNSGVITNCNFDYITDIGLFKNYIKAGYYVCKPLDYKSQCIERTFGSNRSLTVINLEYWFTGTRYNPLWPFKTLFGYTDADILALSKYSEDLIYSPTTKNKKLKRLLTLPPQQTNPKLNIIKSSLIAEDIDCNVARIEECPCYVPKKHGRAEQEKQSDPFEERVERKIKKTRGGRKKTNKNIKQYKNKLQTYKRKKCKQRKTMKRLKKRKTMKQ